VAPLATLVEYAAPLLAEEGRLLAWKGARSPDEEAAGHRAAPRVGLEPQEVLAVTPYRGSRNRHLHLYRKVRPCPPEFPRRVGLAARKPLGQA
jgi:16S rRNA (guanine527-N7)-methyltransferase